MKKELSNTAKVSKAIRTELKKNFPDVKFSVRMEHHGCVNVRYSNAITKDKVEAITNKYQIGSFDGMTDCYEYTNKRDDIPQIEYVFVQRDWSMKTQIKINQMLDKYYVSEQSSSYNRQDNFYQIFNVLEFDENEEISNLDEIDIENNYKIPNVLCNFIHDLRKPVKI